MSNLREVIELLNKAGGKAENDDSMPRESRVALATRYYAAEKFVENKICKSIVSQRMVTSLLRKMIEDSLIKETSKQTTQTDELKSAVVMSVIKRLCDEAGLEGIIHHRLLTEEELAELENL
jgi:hypothetical protein